MVIINRVCWLTAHILLLCTGTTAAASQSSASAFSSPVIGVVAQPRANGQDLYIAASYIKWLEAGGARSIAIPYDETDPEILDALFSQIDAIFLPGGNTPDPSYAIYYLLDKAVKSNREDGHYFPVWGTCLGFEFLVRYIGGDSAVQDGYNSTNVSLPLEEVIVPGGSGDTLYSDSEIYEIVTQQNVTLNNHHWGLHVDAFYKNPSLQSVWQVTSINHDWAGIPFVSTLEPVVSSASDNENNSNNNTSPLPFYGVQYHPEKNAFEYATYPGTNIPYEAINHSPDGITFSMALARFMVNLARQTMTTGQHAYTLPDRFPYVYTYPQQVGIKFEQIFIIPCLRQRRTIKSNQKGYLRQTHRGTKQGGNDAVTLSWLLRETLLTVLREHMQMTVFYLKRYPNL